MYELHHIIQIVIGWTNSHIYQFNHVENIIADPRLVDDELRPVTDVKDVMVTQVFTKVGTTITYEYDFGDGWMHHLNEILMNPKHPEYKSSKRWVSSTFDPMVCDLKTIQQNLGKLRRLIDEYEEGF
jgi:hypothetical protein